MVWPLSWGWLGLQSQGEKGVKWYDVDPPGSLSFSTCASQDPNVKKEILPENIVNGLRDCPGFAQVTSDFVEFGTERLNRWWWCRIEPYVFLNFTLRQYSDESTRSQRIWPRFLCWYPVTLMNLPFRITSPERKELEAGFWSSVSLGSLNNCSSASVSDRWPRKVASLWNLQVPRWGRWRGRGGWEGEVNGWSSRGWHGNVGCRVKCQIFLRVFRWKHMEMIGNVCLRRWGDRSWESRMLGMNGSVWKASFLYIDFMFWCRTTPY